MKKWKKTLLAMFFSWIFGNLAMVLISGAPSAGQVIELLIMTGLFVSSAWLIFIFPIRKIIHQFFFEKKKNKWILPIASALYADFVFIVLFAAFITGPSIALKMIYMPSSLNLYAAFFGFIWGVSLLIIEHYFPVSND